jgi:hypothetical protein
MPGVSVFVLEISRNRCLDSMITRDLVDGLMVGIVMLRGLCYWVFSTKSFKHLALDLTFGKNGTLIRE